MSDTPVKTLAFEPERYELHAPAAYHFDLDRREFLASLGGGILVVLAAPAQQSGGHRGGFGRGMPQQIGAWLHIAEDGGVTVYTGKVEVGQNARTSLTEAVAEELRAPLATVRLVMGDTDLVPFDMGTFGSLTTPTMAPQLHRAAAAARELLIGLAAEKWKTERGGLAVAGGKVTNPATGQWATFGELTRGRKLVETIAADAPVTPAERWQVAGRSTPKVKGVDFVTGRHRYPSDIRRPGMLYGAVLRAPSFGAKLASFNDHAARATPGVVVVRDGEFAGVAAPDREAAERAVRSLRAEWKAAAQPSEGELFAYLKQHAEAGSPREQGSVAEGMAAADHKLRQTYTVAYIAHVPLEPRAAVAEWNGGRLTVWTGTQRPFGVRGELAAAFVLPEDRVRVLMPDMGSGYGGKHTGECAIEAARLARAAGKPVKLVWTREEEFTWAYFRPAGVIEVASGALADGSLLAWEFHNYNSGAAGIGTPYHVPHQRIVFHPTESPLRQGSYRALAATANHFARESHMDELARTLGLDPLVFRLKNCQDPRLAAVLEAAAGRFGWKHRKAAPGHGFGVAAGFEKGDYVATCAEVAVHRTTGQVRVVRVVEAFECGAVVNPDHLRNQIEGSISMGLGGALFEHIEFEDGKILNPRLSRYRVPRFRDIPKIEVVLVDRKDLASAGAGETAIVGIAPALGNAIFDACGTRLRSLPMAPNGVRVG